MKHYMNNWLKSKWLSVVVLSRLNGTVENKYAVGLMSSKMFDRLCVDEPILMIFQHWL